MTRLLALVGLVSILLGGCGSYTIKGRVIEGSMSTAMFVDADDPRLAQSGVPNTQLEVYREPDNLGREQVGRGTSGPDGTITVPVASFGAGFLVEQFEITAQRGGYQPVRLQMPLPGGGSKQKLLVILAPGRSAPLHEDPDLVDLYEQYK